MALIQGADGQPRCQWSGTAPDFPAYHDQEWGFPVADDQRLFEKFCLEAFQSGLSWRTILDKRENFRAAFAGFDHRKLAAFAAEDVERLLQNPGIVRNRRKIEAVIHNAALVQPLIDEFGSLAAYVWQYETENCDAEPQSRTTSPESVAMAKDLKKRGWKFVGPTTVFAFMQAMGLINDHAEGCVIRQQVSAARQAFNKP